MRTLDWLVIAAVATALTGWGLLCGLSGFKGSNGLIVFRSFSITSTIDGQVENTPPPVGTWISPTDLLVKINNPRFDHSRLTELESELIFVQSEIARLDASQSELNVLLDTFRAKSNLHSQWMLADSQLRTRENQKQLEIAHNVRDIKVDRAQRMSALYNNEFASNMALTTAKSEAEIAIQSVELTQTQLERNRRLHDALKKAGAFFDNGDASYWDRMIDELVLRKIESSIAIATLNSQRLRAEGQARVERNRIASSVQEDHHAPFDGLVNATYVSKGTKVTRGTSLLQVSDCSNPVVIVPIPEHRIAEFSVGMDVTIYPVDTESKIQGFIKYISSGPLIGQDDTLQLQNDLTVRGIHAVITFADNERYTTDVKSCKSAHRAVVMIHTQSGIKNAKNWLASLF